MGVGGQKSDQKTRHKPKKKGRGHKLIINDFKNFFQIKWCLVFHRRVEREQGFW